MPTLGTFVFLHEVEYCFFKVCKELCWNFDRDCIEFGDCFWMNGHLHYVNPTNSWEIFSSSDIFSFFQRLEVLDITFTYLIRVIPRYFTLFVAIGKAVISLLFFSAHLSLVY